MSICFVGSSKKKSGRKRKSTDSAAPSAKKKRISFGPTLSPEMFDKKLPPITPVRRGTAPRRLSEPMSVASPKSLLKRKSLAAFRFESTIAEESPKKSTPEKGAVSPNNRKSPKTTPKVKSPKSTPKTKSPTSSNSTPGNKSLASSSKSTPGKRSPKSTPVRAKSPGRSPKRASPKSKTMPVKSPKSSNKSNNADTSYTGLAELMKTPTVATSTQKDKRSSGKSGRQASTGTMNFVGVKDLLRTPKNKLADISFTGLSAMMQTPEIKGVKKETPKSLAKKNTPKKRTPTPRKPSPKSLKNGSTRTRTLKKSPPSTIWNAVAVRAIHGKTRTPKLPTNLWSDIVKTGIAETGVAKLKSAEKPVKVIKKKAKTPKSMKKVSRRVLKSKLIVCSFSNVMEKRETH